jgi:ribonuclease Z
LPRLIELQVLGTAGGVPTRSRALPAVLVRDWNGLSVLFDAGEGVQYSLLKRGIPVTRIDVIAVTHAHGDHINGLPGLLQSMYMHERRRPLTIVGPPSVLRFVRDVLGVEDYRLGFEVSTVEVRGEGGASLAIRGGDRVELKWAPACHTIESYAYRLEWHLRPRLDPEALKKLLGGRVQLIRRLLEEGSVYVEGVGRVSVKEVSTRDASSLAIVYTGDTSEPCDTVIRLSRGARVLIHDATFSDEMADEAAERGHSTGSQAARAAFAAGVYLLILFHVSARYEGREALRILREASKIFPRVILAWDGLKVVARA